MLKSLESNDSDFKTHHLALIDLLGDYKILEREQETLDDHDDLVTPLLVCVDQLIFSLTAGTCDVQESEPSEKGPLHHQRGDWD